MPEPIVQTGDINKAYQWAIETCNAPNVGYSMEHRYQETINGITYYDCSSFVWYALYNGGFINIGQSAFTTYYMEAILSQAGFTVLNAGEVEWLAGDILLGRYGTYQGITDYQHTEMVYQGTGNIGEGYLMGAHGADGITLPNQVSIKNTLNYGTVQPSHEYTVLLRFGNGATGYGLTLAQVGALCGNAWRESTVNPASDGFSSPLDHARGLWSWTDYEGIFYAGTAMINWMTDHGYSDWRNGDAQVQCLMDNNLPAPYEYPADPGSKWLDTAISEYLYTNAQYPDWDSWLQATDKNDVEEMTRQFFLHWEVPSRIEVYNAEFPLRLAFAQKAMDFIREHANDTSITDWIIRPLPESIYLTEAEALNNCVMLWRRLSAGGGGGGTITRVRKMPIWMMTRKRRRIVIK